MDNYTYVIKGPSLLVFVRHAESEGNVLSLPEEHAAQAKSTHAYALTARGRAQAESVRDFLKQESLTGFDTYFSSYYPRALETLDILLPESKRLEPRPFIEDSRLAEAQRGIYHHMSREEIAAKYPEELARRDREGLYHYRPPGGENWPDVEMRIHSFLGTLARDYVGRRVLVVTHGHWLALLRKVAHGQSAADAEAAYRAGTSVPPNASVTEYIGTSSSGWLNGRYVHDNTPGPMDRKLDAYCPWAPHVTKGT